MFYSSERRSVILASLTVLFLSISIFSIILSWGIVTDIQDHITFIIQAGRGELKIPANFLYYLAVYTASFFSSNWTPLAVASVGVLSLAVTTKFMLTYKIMRTSVSGGLVEKERWGVVLLLAVAVMLLFVFSLPTWHGLQNDRWYIGQIPPNVWHNSTITFVMPFALLLFWVSYRNLQNPAPENNLLILLWSVLNILAKPSFYFVFVIVYPLMLLWRIGFSKKFWLNLWPIVVGVMALFGEYVLIYQLGWNAGNRSEIKIALFRVWSHYSPNIPVSVLVSVLYPLTYLLFYRYKLKTSLMLQYSVFLYTAALVIMSLLTETGEREFHGNFIWQSYITGYLLFMAVSVLFVEKLLQPRGWLQKQNVLIAAAFVLHLVTGVLYVARILIYGRYF